MPLRYTHPRLIAIGIILSIALAAASILSIGRRTTFDCVLADIHLWLHRGILRIEPRPPYLPRWYGFGSGLAICDGFLPATFMRRTVDYFDVPIVHRNLIRIPLGIPLTAALFATGYLSRRRRPSATPTSGPQEAAGATPVC